VRREPALDLIDPRCRRRREVDSVVRPPSQPGFDRGGFMGSVIIHDDVALGPRIFSQKEIAIGQAPFHSHGNSDHSNNIVL
jgi:hypothetical protein